MVGRAETRNTRFHSHERRLRLRRAILAVEPPSLPEERGAPGFTQDSPAQSSSAGTRVPTTSGCEQQWRLRQGTRHGGLWEAAAVLLKGPRPVVPTDGLAHAGLQRGGSCLRGARDTQGGAELSGFRARAGGAVCSWTEVEAEAIVPLWSPPLFPSCRCSHH